MCFGLIVNGLRVLLIKSYRAVKLAHTNRTY